MARAEVLFYDDFSGDLSGWQAVAGSWRIVDGQLQANGEAWPVGAWIYVRGGESWTNYAVEARVSLTIDEILTAVNAALDGCG